MADGMYRIGIVGATSLGGKELSDELGESLLAASDFILLDEDESTGEVSAAGDEAAMIQHIEPGSFERMDFVFFNGDAEMARKHWVDARNAGASIVDSTYALDGENGVPVRAPSVRAALRGGSRHSLHLETTAVVAAHPAAAMLGLVAARISGVMPIATFSATVFEPASQHGREAMDELHQQTVNLLSFQSLPREQYGAQVAFNLLPSLGEDAKVQLQEAEARIHRHYEEIGGGQLPELELQMVQAPVFHGYVASVLLELGAEASVTQVEHSLEGEGIDVVAEDSDPPSNLSASGQEDIMVRVRSARAAQEQSRRFLLWIAADNLKLGALNAISCANELKRLRPRGKVQ